MKRLIIILVFFIGISGIYGQQSALYTQYMHNPFILNPAIAGTLNFFQVRIISRWQWVGFNDAPVTNSLSMYGPWSAKNKDMGYGVTVYNDVTGPTSRLGFNGTYAYNRAITDVIRVSLGVSLGMMQYKLDGTKINDSKYPMNDVLLPNSVKSWFLPDATVGAYLYSTNYQVGISADRLFNNKLVSDNTDKALGKLQSHFYLMGSYKYIFNRRYTLESSAIVKKVVPAPYQMDLNFKCIYMNTAWLGLSYRTQDAISVLVGYTFNKKILIGYSYDIALTSMRVYSIGSHEIMIAYKFNPLK